MENVYQNFQKLVTLAQENLPITISVIALVLLLIVLLLFLLMERRSNKKAKAKARAGKPARMQATALSDATEAIPAAGAGGTSGAGPADTGTFPATDKPTATRSQTACQASVVHNIGARRDQQDSWWISDLGVNTQKERGILAVVADGMGGLANGKLVSQLAIETCRELFAQPAGECRPDIRLLELTRNINDRVNRRLASEKERSGSTLVEALIADGRLYFLTLGDSRIYLFRAGKLICLNRPHVYSEELALKAVNNRIPPTAIYSDRQSNALTSFLGLGNLPYLDRNAEGLSLAGGDKILLSSDGVFGTLPESTLEQLLALPPKQAADEIDHRIQSIGKATQDNYTAVILEYYSPGQ